MINIFGRISKGQVLKMHRKRWHQDEMSFSLCRKRRWLPGSQKPHSDTLSASPNGKESSEQGCILNSNVTAIVQLNTRNLPSVQKGSKWHWMEVNICWEMHKIYDTLNKIMDTHTNIHNTSTNLTLSISFRSCLAKICCYCFIIWL